MGIQVIGLEIANREKDYQWSEVEGEPGITRHSLFPDCVVEDVPARILCNAINGFLSKYRPGAVAINGYSRKDALGLLMLCRIRNIPTILMSESKKDDFSRRPLRENVKGLIVRQFGAALCGGMPQREYLIRLGMRAKQIFLGYDAIDNEYFKKGARLARQSPDRYRKLPGLELSTPFFLASARFIRRKNLDGLIRAYAEYRSMMSSVSQGSRTLATSDTGGR